MTKFSRLTLSAALLAGFALPALAPAMASVPASHRVPAKSHAVRGPVRHIAASGTDAVRTPAVGSASVAAPATTAAPKPATATPALPAAGTVTTGTTATSPTATSPVTTSTTAAAPTVTVKPAVKSN